MDNILNDIKSYLNVAEHIDDYDKEIINFINISLFKLNDYGLVLKIQHVDKNTIWSDIVEDKYLRIVKPIIQIKCMLLFDPPQNQTVYKIYKDEDNELTRRLIDFIERT